jgi:hypothetical protein
MTELISESFFRGKGEIPRTLGGDPSQGAPDVSKAIPNSVESHTKVFATFTAPWFPAVRVRRAKRRKTLPCRAPGQGQGSASSADRVKWLGGN